MLSTLRFVQPSWHRLRCSFFLILLLALLIPLEILGLAPAGFAQTSSPSPVADAKAKAFGVKVVGVEAKAFAQESGRPFTHKTIPASQNSSLRSPALRPTLGATAPRTTTTSGVIAPVSTHSTSHATSSPRPATTGIASSRLAASGSAYSGTPFNGPHTLPGKFQIEDYDQGGEGVGYHDADAGNNGGAYRSEDVDIEGCGDTDGGYDVGWTVAGEWLGYSVQVQNAGTYSVSIRVSSPSGGGGLHLEDESGGNLTGSITIPATGGWQSYTTVTASATLTAGPHVLRLVEDAGGYNLNWIAFAAPPVASPPASIKVSPAMPAVTEGMTQQFTAVALDQNGVELSPQPAFNWSVAGSGGGTINASGLYSTGNSARVTVQASASGVTGMAAVAVISASDGFFRNTPLTPIPVSTFTSSGFTLTNAKASFFSPGPSGDHSHGLWTAGTITLNGTQPQYVSSTQTIYSTDISFTSGTLNFTETGLVEVIYYNNSITYSSIDYLSGSGRTYDHMNMSWWANLVSLSLNPTAVSGTFPSTATATIDSIAPTGGIPLQLSSDNSAGVPAVSTVTVPEGSTTVKFTVNTTGVTAVTTSNIKAVLDYSSATAALTILVAPNRTLSSLTVSPSSVPGGKPSVAIVTLNGPAPIGGASIALASSSASASVPASVTIAAGSSSATFLVTTTVVNGPTPVTISASYGGQTLTAPLTVTGAAEISLLVAPSTVVGGSASQGTVTLSSPAPSGGTSVSLSSDSTASGVTVPASVMVSAGQKKATFPVTTLPVGATLAATISATGTIAGATSTATAALTVTPPVLIGLTLNPTTVTGGNYSTGTVTLGSPAPAQGLSVALSSDNLAATAPAVAVIAGGASSGTFAVSTVAVTSGTSANITAALGGVTKTASLTITALTSIAVVPGNAVVLTGATQQFTAAAQDQNGVALTNQPVFTWAVSGGGTISSSGLFTAGSSAGGPYTVTATALGKSGTASVTVETTDSTTTVLTQFTTIKNTKWTIGGYGGMRGIGTGTITISGVTGTITKAYLYWHGPTDSTDPTANAAVTFNNASITGTNIGFADNNCWGFTNSQAYRADVTGLVSGNGSYSLANFVKPNGIDINGATLIVFYNDGTATGNRDVMVFDGNDSNVDYKNGTPEWNETFSNINFVAGTTLYMTLGVSDGQSYTDGEVRINGTQLLGYDSNFSGSVVTSPNYVAYGASAENTNGGLWDIRTFNLTSPTQFLSPGNNSLNLISPEGDDCLSLVYAIIDQPSSGSGNGASLPPAPPTIATAASANPNPVTGATTTLSVLGADSSGEANLTYLWKIVGTPPSPVFLSLNGTNAAKNTVATFTQAGTYMLQVTVQNASGLTSSSFVSVTVNQTLNSLAVAPATATLALNSAQQFTAAMTDQFGTTLSSPPAVTWSVLSGVGTISTNGLYASGAVAGASTIKAVAGTLSATASVTVANGQPTIATAASASPNPVTDTTTTLSVLGADDAGESALTYAWATTGTPPAAVVFSANGTNAAKSSTATFTKAGSYTFQVVVRDAGGLTATSSVTVNVNQTLTTISVTPATATLNSLVTQQFTASAIDQFGSSLLPQPTFTWSLASGVGSVSTSGLYTASASAGSAVVKAASGSVSGTASVTVNVSAPTISIDASASPNPVTGTTTTLSVLGADASGEGNLTYTWGTTGTPPAAVTFSANGTNAAKSSVATFTKAGSYTFQVTVKDAGGLTVTSSVIVTVNQTLTAISVSPASLSLQTGTTQQLTASAKDQFGTALTSQPVITWSVSGVGSVSTAGLYTAGGTAGSATVTVASGSINGSASIIVTSDPPVLTSITVTPATVSVNTSGTQQFTATALDQNGNPLPSQPMFTWSIASGIGGVSTTGLYTAPASTGSAVVKATSDSVNGFANVTVTTATAPTIATAASASPNPASGTTTVLSALGADASGESNLTYTWATTGTPPAAVAFSANSTNAAKSSTATFTKAGSYTFQVTVKNTGGATATSSVTVTVSQTLTTITVAPAPVTIQTSATQQFTAAGKDQFGTTLSTQPPFTWTVSGGGTIGSTNGTFTAGTAVGGPFTVTATSGGVSGTAAVTLTAAVPVATPVIAIGGGAGAATVSITDGTPGAVIFYTLGSATPTNASAPYQGPFVVTSTTTINAIAYLSSSHSAVATATATVTSGSGGSVPTVVISSPLDSSVQTGGIVGASPVIPILGSVSGGSLSAWTLAYRPVSGDDGDSGAWIPLSAGTTAQAAGSTLGALDPTLMLNGLYQIELTAYNTTGQSSSASVTILIKGDQKVGYFTLSYNDMTLPVSGLPITITRTYDSRDKSAGDFGVGWTLSTTNVKVQKADTIGLDWTQYSSGFNFTLRASQSHLITVTFPNGDTYNFVPAVTPASQSGAPYSDTGGTLTYQPVGPNQGATLVGKNNPGGLFFLALPISGGGNAIGVELDGLDDYGDDSGFPLDESEFILTLRNGKQFDVSIDGGLQSIRDLSGNTLTFTPAGIYSSNYSGSIPVVSYKRTNGLITQIIGPSGNPLIYTQTGTDLTGFADRASNASTYDYNYSHGLTGIHDPRGVQPLRNDYDASGRLIDTLDADQNKITYSYDLVGHKRLYRKVCCVPKMKAWNSPLAREKPTQPT